MTGKSKLHRDEDAASYIEVETVMTYENQRFKVKLDVEVIPALASRPCECCGKDARTILGGKGITIDPDDMKVDMYSITKDLDTGDSVLEADCTYVITRAITTEIRDESEITIESPVLESDLDEMATNILKNHILCDGPCLYKGPFLEKLLMWP